jgi:hypothetical protein
VKLNAGRLYLVWNAGDLMPPGFRMSAFLYCRPESERQGTILFMAGVNCPDSSVCTGTGLLAAPLRARRGNPSTS